ncbi:MAG: adenosylmethionine decarboxylase [Thermofilum sp. ex4484_82]|nr:MAG: adenosylmethionine decarboxylase [Thermofilum sp. ex4484_82]OYT35957.1 MAG: adenosylmethionine decarboxylase [Archaeoglobales archaeon ex4484_92]
MNTIGYHYVIEASGCDPKILADTEALKKILLEAAKIGEMSIRSIYFYKFSPQGVSGVIVVSGSHISIHTWPEKGYAAIDVYTCDTESEPEKTFNYILEQLKASYAHITEIERGIEDEDGTYTHIILSWDERPLSENLRH